MEKNPVVSIIVPVYNAEEYLRNLLDSVRRQTFGDYELILVDDGSTDDSLAICKTYQQQDARIRVIHQDNAGASAARNRGIAECVGEYLTFWDADDEVEPDILMVMVDSAQKNKSDLVVCGIYTDLIEKNKVVSSSMMSEPDQVVTGNTAIREYTIFTMHSSIMYSPCNKLYKFSIIKQHGLQMRKDIDMGEDLLFNLEYIKHVESISVCSKAYYHYYQRDTGKNLMAQFRESKVDIIRIWIKELNDFSRELSQHVQDVVSWMRVRWFLSCFIEIAGSSKSLKEKRLKIANILRQEGDLKKIKSPSLSAFQKILVKCVGSGNVLIVYFVSWLIYFYKTKFKNRYYKQITR